MPRSDKQRGFTLLEVLIAFAILVVLLLPLSRSFSLGMLTAERTDSVTGATLLAQSALDTLGQASRPSDGLKVERRYGPYRVLGEVSRYRGRDLSPVDAYLPAVLMDMSVAVRWQEGGRTRSLDLHTLRVEPIAAAGRPK